MVASFPSGSAFSLPPLAHTSLPTLPSPSHHLLPFLIPQSLLDHATVAPPGEGKQAFHVVAPSLPGFAFSSAPKHKGFGLKEIAKTFNQLMLELGYTSYVAQGELAS